MIAYYAGLIVAWVSWRRRAAVGSQQRPHARRNRVGAIAIAGVAAVWILAEPWTFLALPGDGRLHVTFIDVGQGDAAFVRFPRGATLLVDAGGLAFGSPFDIGDRVVAPVLRDAALNAARRHQPLPLQSNVEDMIKVLGERAAQISARACSR